MRLRKPINSAICVLVFALLVGAPAADTSAEYDLIRNDIGRVLGMNYVKDGNTTRGEFGNPSED